jgi:competence ComEA-like helix-hairpin-helix protein
VEKSLEQAVRSKLCVITAWLLLLAWLAGGTVTVAGWQGQEPESAKSVDWSLLLPEGEGKIEVVIACSDCHGLKQLLTQKKTQQGWQTSVQKMISIYQAPLAQAEVSPIVSYLAKHFGTSNPIEQLPININTSSAKALGRLPGVSAEIAQAIIECRQTKGPFTTLNELLQVKGVDAATLKRIEPYITVAKQASSNQ